MGIHWPRQEEGGIMWSVELVTKDVNGGNSFDVVFCAEVGGQKATKLHQCIMTLQEDKEFYQHQKDGYCSAFILLGGEKCICKVANANKNSS